MGSSASQNVQQSSEKKFSPLQSCTSLYGPLLSELGAGAGAGADSPPSVGAAAGEALLEAGAAGFGDGEEEAALLDAGLEADAEGSCAREISSAMTPQEREHSRQSPHSPVQSYPS